MKLKPIKIITNRSTYKLNFQRYEGKITEIIRLDDKQKFSFRTLQKTSDLNISHSMIRIKHLSMMQKEYEAEGAVLKSTKDISSKTREEKPNKAKVENDNSPTFQNNGNK